MRGAIVAHFSAMEAWDENFLQILRIVCSIVDRVVVVTTNQNIPDLPIDLVCVKLIRRPNIGYDFYSYRVGISLFGGCASFEQILIMNSSITMLNAQRFRSLLIALFDQRAGIGVRGVIASRQIAWHVQSFLICFNLKYLPEGWLQGFFERVEPVNSKFEVIVAYEIGLGRQISSYKIRWEVVFRAGASFIARYFVRRAIASIRVGAYKSLFKRSFWNISELNYSHFAANELAMRFGFVKTEVLRTNPHRLDLKNVWTACDADLMPSIVSELEATQRFYSCVGGGLTEFKGVGGDSLLFPQPIQGPRHKLKNARVGVIIHVFYMEPYREIIQVLDSLVEPFDLHVTTPFASYVPGIIELADSKGLAVRVYVTPNRGRDVGPFVGLIKNGFLDKYDAVLKLHTKKSLYSNKGDFWRRDLVSSLCGDSQTILRSISLIRSGRCGIVGPEKYFLSNEIFWGANRERVSMILRSCGVSGDRSHNRLGFFAGTMFWFSPAALAGVRRVGDEALSFEDENGKQDGTLAHAWERVFSLIACAEGYEVSTVSLGGRNIFDVDTSGNRVPTLET